MLKTLLLYLYSSTVDRNMLNYIFCCYSNCTMLTAFIVIYRIYIIVSYRQCSKRTPVLRTFVLLEKNPRKYPEYIHLLLRHILQRIFRVT